MVRRTREKDLSLFDEAFLAKSLHQRLTATSSGTWAAYLDRLAHAAVEADALLQSLNIGYSEFFRNSLTFALLEQLVLPNLLGARKDPDSTELRVWSAGCAAGQEAWSVAILLEDLALARGRPIPWRLFATDVSGPALAEAQAGVYDRAAVQNVPLKHLQRYFIRDGESYQILPRLKDRVDFSTFDLLDDRSGCPPASLYGDFDLVLCCNLFFYYRLDIRQRILDKICRALSPGGYVATGEAEEQLVARQKGLRAVAPPSALFQKKRA
ncbi:MAG: hypothetical protein NTW03_06750 [Verrucomicrobia bacterium]|nr:hypothetical protein [Verrucomicrobiota bacterium]